MMRRALLGLAGSAVEPAVRTVLGVKIVQLVTDDPDAARRPGCRVLSSLGKDWVLTRPHDLPRAAGSLRWCGGAGAGAGGRSAVRAGRSQACSSGGTERHHAP